MRSLLTHIRYVVQPVVIGAILALSCSLVTAQAPRPAAVRFRIIRIVAEPNSVIWVDGVRYGAADSEGNFELKTVSPGGHILRVRADGFKEKTMTVSAVQKGVLKVPLIKTSDPAELAFQEAERLTGQDREKAAEAYRRAVKLRPNFADAHLGLARVLTETGDLEQAERAVNAARRSRPGYAEASAVLGRIHKENGDYEKAITAFRRAISEGKGFQPEALTGLGLLYKEKAESSGGSGNLERESADYSESVKYLSGALKQLSGAPDAIVIYQLLGLVYERLNKIDEAIALYEEFLRIFPDSTEATAVRSFIVQLRKQTRE